jgi:ParB family chromosome partitioning protein
MAKRKLNAQMLIDAGKGAHFQKEDTEISHAKQIGGEVFLEIDVKHIYNNPMQPRLKIDEEELQALADSIKEHGLIQPITVIREAEDKYILKAGQRRWLAHKLAKMKNIKAIVEMNNQLSGKESDKRLFEIAVMENIQRDKLDPLELALSIKKAMDCKFYPTLEELGKSLKKSKSYLSKAIKVLSLEDQIIKDLEKNRSTNDIETLYEIQKIKDSKKQIALYFDFIEKKIDRAGIRKLNKTKISHAKQEPYIFKKNKNKMSLEVDLTRVGEGDRGALEKELEILMAKYFTA